MNTLHISLKTVRMVIEQYKDVMKLQPLFDRMQEDAELKVRLRELHEGQHPAEMVSMFKEIEEAFRMLIMQLHLLDCIVPPTEFLQGPEFKTDQLQ